MVEVIQVKHTIFSFIIVPILFLLFVQSASAMYYFGGSNENYYFEVYSKGTYNYAAQPYTYYYSDHYYFDYPFRYYAKGTYYYQDKGWYDFSPNYYLYPGNSAYYNYHSPDYYYYNYNWNYYPNWMTVYAPNVYGSYYYPPSYFYGTPTLTGQHYQPEQVSLCSDASIATSSISLNAGETRRVTFFVDNSFAKDLRVNNVNIYVNSFDAQALNVQFDKTVNAFSSGKITFDVSAKENANTQSVSASVKVNGTFSDGVFCSGNGIENSFSINVQGKPVQMQRTPDSLYAGVYYNPSGSTSQIVPRNTVPQQEWNDVTITRSAEIEQVNLAQQNLQQTQNYQTQNYNTVQTYYGEAQLAETSCNGLSLNEENVAVDAESSKVVYFAFKNFGKGDFQIDSIESVESNGFFGIEALRENPYIFSGQTSAIKVKVLGGTTETDASGSAYVRVNGHFNSGLNCTILSDNFFVRVNGSSPNFVEKVSISNPGKVELNNGSGFVEFQVDNAKNRDIVVSVRSDNAMVSPKKFSINAMSIIEKVVAINGLEGEGIVYFDIDEEPGFLEKFTRIEEKEMNVPFQPNNSVQVPIQPSPPQVAPPQGLGGFLNTGFGVLGDGALLLGVIVLIIIVVLMAIPRN